MGRRKVPGTVYLLHFEEPIGNTASRTGYAQHYTGWASNLAARLAQHQASSDVKIMAAVRQAGIGWSLARTWPGDRNRERQLKIQGGAARHCPVCKGGRGYAIEAGTSTPKWRPPVAEPEREPLWESVSCHLEPAEAAALLGELTAAEQAAWPAAAVAGGAEHERRFALACDLSRLRGQEARAVERLAEARAIAVAEGSWPELAASEQHRGAPALRVVAQQQEGPAAMGNMQDEREVIEAQQAGAREADEVTMAAISHGRDPAWLSGWARDASAGLFGASVSDADRAFAAGFERQALSLAADHAEASAEPRPRSIPREYMSRAVQRLGETSGPGIRDLGRDHEREAGS